MSYFCMAIKYYYLFTTTKKTKRKSMETNETMIYEAPQVEVVEVEVENGFAMSSGGEEGVWS